METQTATKKKRNNFPAQKIEAKTAQAGARAFKEPRRVRFEVDFFYKMMELGLLPEDASTEIIDGELIERMPIGSKHAGVVSKLTDLLRDLTANKFLINMQNPVHLDKYNEPLPDISVLKRRADYYTESHPTPEDVLLLIEVSDTTVRYDKETKLSLYAEAGIREFWLVNLPERTIEVYSEPKTGFYGLRQTFSETEIARGASIEVSFPAAEIFGSEEKNAKRGKGKVKNTKEKK